MNLILKRIMLALVLAVPYGCGSTGYGGRDGAAGDPAQCMPLNMVVESLTISGADLSSGSALGEAVRRTRASESASIGSYRIEQYQELLAAMRDAGFVAKVQVTSATKGLRVFARPCFEEKARHESAELTDKSTLNLEFGNWRIWGEDATDSEIKTIEVKYSVQSTEASPLELGEARKR